MENAPDVEHKTQELPRVKKQLKLRRRPILTVLSYLMVFIFGFGCMPILEASFEKQLAPENFNSEYARESTSQASVLAWVFGIMLFSTIGAALGLVLAIIAAVRKERWKYVTYFSIFLQTGLLVFGLYCILPLINFGN